MKIGDRVLEQMKSFMDYSVRKQKLITSNLANVSTPGYKAKELRFDDYLKQETGLPEKMAVSEPGHLQGIPRLKRPYTEGMESQDAAGPDGNNVSLEKEITSMAQNVLKFTVVSNFFHHKLVMLRNSIKEGKG